MSYESTRKVSARPFSPGPENLAVLGARVPEGPAVRKVLRNAAHYRLLSIQLADRPDDAQTRPPKPDTFRGHALPPQPQLPPLGRRQARRADRRSPKSAVPPPIASGTNGSGIGPRYADCLGKRPGYRVMLPCSTSNTTTIPGPYRHWQCQDGQVQVLSSVSLCCARLCPATAPTILDNGSDITPAFSKNSSGARHP